MIYPPASLNCKKSVIKACCKKKKKKNRNAASQFTYAANYNEFKSFLIIIPSKFEAPVYKNSVVFLSSWTVLKTFICLAILWRENKGYYLTK